ncbi:23S rRNA (adenine(1618)-N(6))-methyltransferase RlmF [Kordia sp. YSTF-M3]|uniref:Ribosomal RNA large subunit methyltransferase F n=1 Tax=Kordia aestuariivivens TaxID=2759037 RepID=A0ABR7Q519_9FLAO|nr:23S rRNA (adenine(1618)-N(6))-methyltransferase RlmF [Kordia aestuariivivens]MBC8753622.1 23S rRNA (adenine(1618)-N(6))-methyltransferase RlmF [Kordia aestuariivivens]
MDSKKKRHEVAKSKLHPLNKHRERYDFKLLIERCPELDSFVKPNKFGDESIDFFNPEAVKMLNKALLKQYYHIDYWDIPENYLCPPIPGRADYIHYVASLLGETYQGEIPKGKQIKCLDIGTGANLVYPIIGTQEYGWSFIASDIDPISIENAQKIITENSNLTALIEIRHQTNPNQIFKGIVDPSECISVTICNPPFHKSAKEAQAGTTRKLQNLKGEKSIKTELNFGGQSNELWCKGGEKKFIKNMIKESKQFGKSCLWFTTLVSKEVNLPAIYNALKLVKATTVKTIPMGQGNKVSRIVAWSFL